MSIEISRADIMNAYLNPLVSRQVTLKIKSNTIAFVLEPSVPEFVERQRGLSRTTESKWKTKTNEIRRPSEMAISTLSRNQDDQGALIDPQSQIAPESLNAPVKLEEDRKWTVIKDNQKLGPLTTIELNSLLDQSPGNQKLLIKNIQENKIWTYDFYMKTCKNKETTDSVYNKLTNTNEKPKFNKPSNEQKEARSNESVEDPEDSVSKDLSIDEEPLGVNYFQKIDLMKDQQGNVPAKAKAQNASKGGLKEILIFAFSL